MTPLWADESHILFRDEELAEGTLLVTTQLIYAPGAEEPLANSANSETGDGARTTQ